MKALIVLIGLLYVTEAFTQAKPVSMKGQADAAYQLPKQEIQVPFSQYTNLGGLAGLIETGNFNALVNPGGEHVTSGFGWTVSPGSFVTPTVAFHSGKQSVRVTSTLSQLFLSQTSTINVASLTGTQGVASAWISTGRASMQVCALVDGAELNCVNINNDGVWREYVIPFVFGSTSYGLIIKSTVSGTGSVALDDAYVGFMPSTMSPEVAQAQSLGSIKFGTDCTSGAATGSFTDFTDASCTKTISGSILAASANRIGASLPAGSPPGRYVFQFVFPARLNVAAVSESGYFALNYNGTRFSDILYRQLTANDSYDGLTLIGEVNETTALASAKDVYLQGRISTASDVGYNSQADSEGYLIVTYYPPASKIYSQANNEGAWVSFTPTGSWSTNTTYSGRYRKDGAYVEVQYFLTTAGAPTSATLNLNTPTVNGSPLVIDTANFGDPSVNNDTRIDSSGAVIDAGTAVWGTAFLQYASTTSFLVRTGNSAAQAVSVTQASPMTWASGDKLWLYARFPVVGWTTSQITGTFANVVTAPGISKPKTVFLSFGGAGSAIAPTVCSTNPCTEYSDSNSAFSTPGRTSAGLYTSTMSNGTFANSTFIDCKCVAQNSVGGAARGCHLYYGIPSTNMISNTSGGATFTIYTFSAGTATANDSEVIISCTGQAP